MKSKTLTLLIVFAMCCIQGIQAQKRTNNITIIMAWRPRLLRAIRHRPTPTTTA